MLALKTVLAEADATLLVFDEVDANVGEVGRAVGAELALGKKTPSPLCDPPSPSGFARSHHYVVTNPGC